MVPTYIQVIMKFKPNKKDEKRPLTLKIDSTN